MAMALACAAYSEQVQPQLIQRKLSRKVSRELEAKTPEQLSVGKGVSNYLKAIGVYGA
jgi:hypothetical protein